MSNIIVLLSVADTPLSYLDLNCSFHYGKILVLFTATVISLQCLICSMYYNCCSYCDISILDS